MRRVSLLALFVLAACATAPTTPYRARYLIPLTTPVESAMQVEALEPPWVRVRGGDTLLDVSAELMAAHAVAVHVMIVNLSTGTVSLTADTLSLVDGSQNVCVPYSAQQVVQPLLDRALMLETRAKSPTTEVLPADAVLNLDASASAPSIDKQDAVTARAEAEQLRRYVEKNSWTDARLPPNRRTEGTLYFARPKSWPAVVRVRANDQSVAAAFTVERRPTLNHP